MILTAVLAYCYLTGHPVEPFYFFLSVLFDFGMVEVLKEKS